jgi:hypothetical protein
MNKWELSRRQILKDLGLGAACLPLLRAGTSVAASGPNKLLVFAATEGYRTNDWLPPDGPLTAALPRSSSPLEKHKANLIYLHDMTNKAFTGCSACGHGAYGTIYNGLPPKGGTGEYAEPNGATIDQIVGTALAKQSVSGRPSLNLGVQIDLPPSKGGPGHDHAFWVGADRPINPELDPYKTYTDLFGGSTTSGDDAAAKKILAKRQSILDYVGGSLERYKARLGTEDKQVIDGHFQSIRQLEQQLQSAGSVSGGKCGIDAVGMLDIKDNNNYEKILTAHVAIMFAALRCGVSQVATLQLGDATGDSINFGAFVPGIPPKGTGYKTAFRNWHDLGHNPVMNGVDHKQIVDQWWMGKLSTYLDQLKMFPDAAGGTMFDNSVVLWGNHMHEGSDHGSQRIPWLLATKTGGYLKTGQALGAGKPTSGALAEICNAMGVTTHPFGAAMEGLRT